MTDADLEVSEQNPAPSVMIATPMYGGMCSGHYMVGVLNAIIALSGMGSPVYFVHIMNESLITRARNELARQFLEQNFDYLMFIDADISFDGQAVAELMKANKDIVCGIYPKKEIAWGSVIEAATRGEKNLRDFSGAYALNLALDVETVKTDEQGLIEVQHAGTGFMLIHRRVFEAMASHVPDYRISSAKSDDGNYSKPLTKEFFTTSIDKATGVLLSEDYHFCEAWRKIGGKVYVNPAIKLEHVGTYVYGGNVLQSGYI